jgi:hypothetical protein
MDWQAIIKTVAPWAGAALGGPLGGLAIGALADALGLSEKTESALKSALGGAGATPEQLLAVKSADQAFALQMQALGFANAEKLAALATDNTAGARAMQATTRSNIPAALAVLITVGFFGILIGMMAGRLSVTDNQALLILLGGLSAAWGAVVNFYYGSSADSHRKTEMLNR